MGGGIHQYFAVLIGTSRNGIFEGTVFVAIGAWYAFRPLKLSKFKCGLLFILSFICYSTEVVTLSKLGMILHDDYFLFLIPAVFALFPTVINVVPRKIVINTKRIRSLSTVIYLIHLWVNFLVEIVLKWIVPAYQSTPLLQFFTVSLISTILGGLLVKIKEKTNSEFIRTII